MSRGQRGAQARDAVDRLRHELLAAVAGMDAHAQDEVGVARNARDVLRLALGIERDADLEAVLARGGDRRGDVVDDLVVERRAVAARRRDLREVAQRVVDHEVAVEHASRRVHARRDRLRTTGPIVIGSTKCPSPTSKWKTRQPASRRTSICSPSRAKSAA